MLFSEMMNVSFIYQKLWFYLVTLIAEEQEEFTNVEDWKIELCDERIQYMIY